LAADSRITEIESEQKRDETLSLEKIDVGYLRGLIEDQLENFKTSHQDYFEQRKGWMLALRDLQYKYREGYFDQASDLHVPYTLIMSKAMHARIFQIFSQKNFFSVGANNVAFRSREEVVTYFMNWVLDKWANRGRGKADVMDRWIQDIVDEGSGILKLSFDRWKHTFVDVDIEVSESPVQDIFTSDQEVEVEERTETKARIKNVKKTLSQAAPRLGTVSLDDFFMPAGSLNVQEAPFVAHRVFLTDDDLKLRAQQGKFDKELVEEALSRRRSPSEARSDNRSEVRPAMRNLEGLMRQENEATNRNDSGLHTIIEWYGKAYVEKDVDDDTHEDVDTLPEEIVVWYNADIREIIGWTYLHRISPSGHRPFYKADFVPSKERAFGVGIGELLWSLNNHIDAVHNLKLDNGMLASLQFGVYRSSSTFKPDTFRIKPGDLIPVEDVNDFKFVNVPYLGQFGENEELTLTGYGEKLLAINDINLGNLTGRGVAGALRNATGASFVDRQANIQLNPHLDRIARELKACLSDLFILCRSRMDEQLFFRVTGEDGKAIFGDVTREDLRGDYDFSIDVDLAATSEAERQQRVTLMLQTLLNPTLMQLGIVQPQNVFEVVKEYLIRHQIRTPDTFLTKPQGYTGAPLTPQERIFKIMMGQGDDPPVEQTVRPEENHEFALALYDKFKESDLFAALDRKKLGAFAALVQEHTKYQTMLAGGMKGMPNTSGTQMPMTGGLGGIQGGAGGGPVESPLQAPMGEANGPVQ
jgi:hypothetical protein